MAIKNFTGFETGDTSERITTVTSGTGAVAVQSTVKRTGSYALKCTAPTTSTAAMKVGRPDSTSLNIATAYHRVYVWFELLPVSASEEVIALNDLSSVLKLAVRVDSNGALSLWDSTGTAQIGSDWTGVTTGRWYRIELSCASGASAAVELKVDGASVISGTGNTGTSNHRDISLGKQTDRNGKSVTVYYDDWKCDDASFPGAGACVLVKPTGDGSAVLWTVGAGGGSDWENVDELPPDGSTTYLLSTLTAGNEQYCVFEDLPAITLPICAVKALAVCLRDGASNGAYIVRIKRGADASSSASLTSTSTYVGKGLVADVDPSTMAAWTVAGVNGCEAGVVENSAAERTRVTAIYLMADVAAFGAGGGFWGGGWWW